ncbi:MAG: hypothetical protein KBT34_01740 [Prevotella sp.]|nr:hypothetical protein [Candidatus Prevotella equi]
MWDKIYNILKSMYFWTIIGAIAGVASAVVTVLSFINTTDENNIGICVGNKSVPTIYDINGSNNIALLFQICSDDKTTKKIAPFCVSLCNISDKPLEEYEYSINTEHIKLGEKIKIPAIFDDGNSLLPGNFTIDWDNNHLELLYKNNKILYPTKYDDNFKYWNFVTDHPLGNDGELARVHALLNIRNHNWYRELNISALFFDHDANNHISKFAKKHKNEYDEIFIITLGHESIIIPRKTETHEELAPIEVLEVIGIRRT